MRSNTQPAREPLKSPTRNYLTDLLRYPQLSSLEEFNHLHATWKRTGSQHVYNQMLYGCTRIVRSVVMYYTGSWADSDLINDLMQEGFIGVGKGIEDYDPAYEVHFFTYFHWKIRAEVGRFNQNNQSHRQMRLPVHLLEKSRLIEAQRYNYFKLHGQQPDDETLFSWIHRFDDSEDGTKLAQSIRTKDLVTHARIKGERTVYLDEQLSDGDDSEGKTRGEIIGGVNHDHDSLILAKRLLTEYVGALERVDAHLDNLCKNGIIREQAGEIVRLRYGVKVARILTLESIRTKFGCSRQNVEQMEKVTLTRLCLGIYLTPGLLAGLVKVIATLAEYVGDIQARSLVAKNIPDHFTLDSEAKNSEELLEEARAIGCLPRLQVRRPVLYRIKSKPPEFTFLRTISQYFTLSYRHIMTPYRRACKGQTAHLILVHLLRVKLGWSAQQIAAFLNLPVEHVERSVSDLCQQLVLDATFTTLATEFETVV